MDTVSVTSGASVPEDLVEGVLAFLAERGYPDAKAVHTAEESLIFALPPELRRDMRAAEKAQLSRPGRRERRRRGSGEGDPAGVAGRELTQGEDAEHQRVARDESTGVWASPETTACTSLSTSSATAPCATTPSTSTTAMHEQRRQHADREEVPGTDAERRRQQTTTNARS